MELVLAQDVRGEAVGVGTGGLLRHGNRVDLPVRLLERLGDLMLLKPVPPRADLGRLPPDRMPQLYPRVRRRRQCRALEGAQPAIGVAGGNITDDPDQPADQGANQRVVQVILGPAREVPAPPGEENPLQAPGLADTIFSMSATTDLSSLTSSGKSARIRAGADFTTLPASVRQIRSTVRPRTTTSAEAPPNRSTRRPTSVSPKSGTASSSSSARDTPCSAARVSSALSTWASVPR